MWRRFLLNSPQTAFVTYGGLLDLDVADDKVLGGELVGDGVSLSVLEEAEEELDRLYGPSTLGGLEGLSLSGTADTTVEAAERDALLVLLDVGEVCVGLGELHAVEGGSGFPRVLEVNPEVAALGKAELASVLTDELLLRVTGHF